MTVGIFLRYFPRFYPSAAPAGRPADFKGGRMRTVYRTDGSPECFFTAVFDAWRDDFAFLFPEPDFQAALDDRFEKVTPSAEKTARVLRKIKALDGLCPREIDCVLRTPDADREQAAFLYIRLLVGHGKPVRGMLTHPEVRRVRDLADRVAQERHRLTGFLRFRETESGVYYAPCAPDNDVVELLMPHFAARFKTFPFVIHDVSRKIAGLCNGREWKIVPAPEAAFALSAEEENFEKLWKKYYASVNIPSRRNLRQQKGYMPVRYWKYLTEDPGKGPDPGAL